MHLQTQITSAHRIQKSKRIGKSSPKRASTGSPKQLFTFSKPINRGSSKRTPFTSNKGCSLQVHSQSTSRNFRVHDPGRKPLSSIDHPREPDRRKELPGTVCSPLPLPLKEVSLSIIFGVPATWVSIQNSTLSNNLSLYLSHTLQSLKYPLLYCKETASFRLSIPKAFTSCRRKRCWISQRAISA